ncbi:lysine (K)-specific demethylase 2Aa isoform X2 [Betta splendens]|uniref:[histone H3]-dimethyl-L-lysine(36) demethylase n=1 Tax=Betta splendens TaxID=158456 RepID=A0A6P7LWP7_BETSP|nr:lysine (K)-specific demethylase 2Aa isoform X2 [Betta splendens]
MGRTGTRRRYHDDGISDEEIDGKRMFDLEEKVSSQRFSSGLVVRMEGKDFTYEFVQKGGLRDPILFERPDGLGIKMPDPDFSVSFVKTLVGSRRMIDVMDVSTQKGTEMSMAQWTRYYETPPAQREKLYNVISLEFSHTRLENLVKRPTTVDLIDWVDNMWPRHLKERQRDSTNSINEMQYPKVQKYCLMSVEGCYTDFHIDFGGTSVWYHILRGSKVFWLIPPTPQNLELYENWVLSGKQGDIFLGDRAPDCQRIELTQGCTFIIPSGWIHAVYTPVDSMVFGGNFLHSFNISMQLNICNIEDRTRVPVKFRYPFYYEMCWYVLERYVFSLTRTSYMTPDFQKYSLGIGLKKPSGSDLVSEQVEEAGGSSDDAISEQPSDKPTAKVHLTPLELEGLWNLLGKLESLPSNKKCVPAGIHNAPALITHIKVLLKEHANDNPKLSYTGKPIIKWPKRPLWYQPPPPPPPPPRPKLASTPIIPRPQKPASSMSVLRRRRVRCKRCEACMRPECGECNFCRDMKKFGGPGKLKQTCVLRQCLSPGLPLSAVCEVCKEPNQEETGDLSLTLMECSNCAQIVHPACLTVQGEGVVNKDLPSCWECPKCVQGITDPESSGSDESLAASHQQHIRPHGPLVLRLGHGPSAAVGGPVGSQQDGDVVCCSFFPPPPPSSSCSSSSSASLLLVAAPLPSQPISSRLSKGDKGDGLPGKRKSSTLLDARMAKIYRQQRHSRDGDDSASDDDDDDDDDYEGSQRRKMALYARGAGQSSRRGFGANRRGLLRGGSALRGSRGGLMGPGSSVLKLKRGMGVREAGRRGRGVKVRGGSRMQRRGDETEESDEDDEDEDEEEEEEEEEDSEDGDREQRHRRGRRRRRTDDEDEDSEGQEFDPEEEEMDTLEDDEEEEELEDGRWDSDPEPPVLLVSDLSDDLLSGSYLTVTLQQPHKAKKNPCSIVPKLEAAMGLRAASVGAGGQQGFIHRKMTLSKSSRLRSTDGTAESGARGPGRPRLRGNHGDCRDRTVSSSEEEEAAAAPASSLSPMSLLSLPSFKDVGSEKGGEKEVWVSVFSYLSRAELLACMTVCKAWYKWSCDKRLWSHVDVSRCSSFSNQALAGIVKRQPTSLDLSWTPLAKRQLNCLLTRLPGLRELRLTGLPWSCLSALVSPTLPYLRLLDLRWCEGITDSQIKDIITPPDSESTRSRLRNIVTLRLSGLDVSESTLRLLQRHMPQLERLDLAYCRDITDSSIALLASAGTHTRNNLSELTVAGCIELTDSCLSYLKRLSSLTLLDLRGCTNISRRACDTFISDLSHVAVYCMMEEKLIQRLDEH